jgi:hypothetical protein
VTTTSFSIKKSLKMTEIFFYQKSSNLFLIRNPTRLKESLFSSKLFLLKLFSAKKPLSQLTIRSNEFPFSFPRNLPTFSTHISHEAFFSSIKGNKSANSDRIYLIHGLVTLMGYHDRQNNGGKTIEMYQREKLFHIFIAFLLNKQKRQGERRAEKKVSSLTFLPSP